MTPTDPPPYQEIDEAAQNRSLSSKTLEQPIGPVYMHYVVFAEDEPMESRRPIYDNDRSMGRILVKSVPPPHTVRTISRVLRRIEGFNASDASQLFVPLSNRVPEEDSTYVNLSGHSPSVGLLSVGQPLALVVHSEASLRSKERVETSSELLETCNINYVHYRLYSEEGALVSKRSFKEGDPSLGRLNILSIRPPHTVWTLRKRIAKVEDLDPSGLQILADIFSETAVIDNAGLPLVGEAYYVGKTQGQAMACVCGPLDAVTTLERVVTMRQDAHKCKSPNIFLAPSANLTTTKKQSWPLPPIEPRYVYYRLYIKGGPSVSKYPVYDDDRSIGRLLVQFVTPPHTAGSLRRNLCKIEGIAVSTVSHLFPTLWSQESFHDLDRLALSEDAFPGSSERDPVVLVVDSDGRMNSHHLNQQMLQVSGAPPKIAFVYYRVFSEDGEVASKTSFDKDDPSLGRINVLSVKPPHIIRSLKECIAVAESLRIISDAFPDIKLFSNLFSRDPMGDGPLSFHEGSHLGCQMGEPVVLVYKQDEQTMSSRRVVSNTAVFGHRDPLWVSSYSVGDIFYTDGVKRSAAYLENGLYGVYLVYSSTGRKGYAHVGHLDFAQN